MTYLASNNSYVKTDDLGNVTSHTVGGLNASTGYVFKIQARDAVNNWSTDASPAPSRRQAAAVAAVAPPTS